MGERRGGVALIASLAALAAVLVAASAASAATSFCLPGEGAGQCEDARELATAFATDRLYVADEDNNRVNAFKVEAGAVVFDFAFGWDVDPSGGTGELERCDEASGCQKGLAGAGAGQLSAPRWIAVDNLGGGHDVYVSDENDRISRFDEEGNFLGSFGQAADECQLEGNLRPVSVGPEGNVFAAVTTGTEPNFTGRVVKFSPAGECLEAFPLWENEELRAKTLAVDSEEDAYMSIQRAGGEIRKYELATATEICRPDPGINTLALSLDGEDRLLASQREFRSGFLPYDVLTEYDPSCGHLRRFGYDVFGDFIPGVASLPSPGGDVFAAENRERIAYLFPGGPGPIAIEESMEVTAIGNTQASVVAEVNPEGEATEVRLDYVSEKDYEADQEEGGDGFEGAGTRSEVKELEFEAAEDFEATAIGFELGCAEASAEAIEEGECLAPETRYRWRAVAMSEGNEAGSGEARKEGPPFETKQAIEATLFATGVDTTTATVNALVNPLGIPASGFFEYVTEKRFEEEGEAAWEGATRVPAGGEIDLGSGKEAEKHSATLHPLAPGTAYRYRLGAIDLLLEEHLYFEAAFTTFRAEVPQSCPGNEAFRAGASAALPDCRAYELVSPLDKEGGDIIVLNKPPAVISQSSLSGERLTYGSYRAFGDAQSAPYTSQYLSERDATAGWLSHGISPPQEHLIKGSTEIDFEFRAFSEDLCQGWIVPLATPALDPEAEAEHRNLYRREDRLCGAEGYGLFSNAKPENLSRQFLLEPQGSAAGGQVAVFAANDTLEGSGAPEQGGSCGEEDPAACRLRLYLRDASDPGGEPRFVCVKPGGETVANGDCTAGSFDLSAIFGQTRGVNTQGALSADGSLIYWTDSLGNGKIYLRENPLGDGAECSGAASPCSLLVSEASSSYFQGAAADGSRAYYTTGGLSGGNAHLFAYSHETGESSEIAEGVFGVLGSSEDGERVYFAAGEVFDPEAQNEHGASPEEGKPNLYLAEAGEEPVFIGTLDEADVAVSPALVAHTSATSISPTRRNSRVSPDGETVAFMSVAALSGYDNTDADSGEADNEVFLYDAAAGELICASCDPSGARPKGVDLGIEADPFWVAARIGAHQSSLYAGGNLAPSGDRLYFESIDPLSPRDTNGRFDVYQWERLGAGGCAAASSGYSAKARGCVDLISSGAGGRDAVFLDASASGDDVFFTTLASLLPEDYGLVDVYDARVGGGFPSPPAPASECEGEGCQSPAPAPGFLTPSSALNFGPGNLAAPKKAKRRCAKGKREIKRKGKVRCVKKKKAKGKRARHRRAVHRRAGRPR